MADRGFDVECVVCKQYFVSAAHNAKICTTCKPEWYRMKGRAWREVNKGKAIEMSRRSYANGVKTGRVSSYEDRPEVRQRRRDAAKAYYWNNREKVLSRMSTDEGRKYSRERMRKNMKDPKFRLSSNFSRNMRAGLDSGKGGKKWETLVGYKLDDLVKHLERQFLPGMTIENHGKWHIDHIRPISSFSYSSYDDAEFLDCWSLSNLRPLWAKDNISKHSKREFLI